MPSAFSALVDDFLRQYWRLNPVEASLAGVHDHDDELGDLTERGFRERDAVATDWERRFASIEEPALAPEERIDRDFLLATLRGATAMQPFETWARHAPIYPQTIALGAYALFVRDFAPLEERLARIAARLSRARLVVDAAIENLDPPRTAPVHVVVAGEIAAATATFVRAYLPSVAPDGPVKRDLVLTGQEAGDALDRYAAWLRDDLMKRARGGIAVGRDTLDALLRRQHLLDEDAVGILRLGRETYEETRSRLLETARTMGAEDPAVLVADLKRDHPPAEELAETYRREVERAREAVTTLGLVTMPAADDLDIVETPDFYRPISPYAHHFAPGPFERDRKGYLFVTLPEARGPERDREQRLRGHARAAISVIVVHQTFPGHHVQRTRAVDHASPARRAFRTTFLDGGWGLYCEELMQESGYLGTPATRLMQLGSLLFAAARAIVDVGLATGEMNFEQAVNFLVESAMVERPNAIAEVRRYTLAPTQPMSDLVGRRGILRLRERARGSGMELRAFHDSLLAVGSVPLRLLERALRA